MANSGSPLTKLVAMIFICMVTIMPGGSEAQTSCGTVSSRLYPCLSYIKYGGRVPSRTSLCCRGVRYLVKVSKTRTTRQGICTCLNKINSLFTDAQIRNAARLPRSCRASIPYAIKRNIDCSRVK